MMHYVNLLNTYPCKNDIKEHFQNQLLAEVKETAETSENYKYFIYRQFNPELKALSTTHRNLSRLRLSSHNTLWYRNACIWGKMFPAILDTKS